MKAKRQKADRSVMRDSPSNGQSRRVRIDAAPGKRSVTSGLLALLALLAATGLLVALVYSGLSTATPRVGKTSTSRR